MLKTALLNLASSLFREIDRLLPLPTTHYRPKYLSPTVNREVPLTRVVHFEEWLGVLQSQWRMGALSCATVSRLTDQHYVRKSRNLSFATDTVIGSQNLMGFTKFLLSWPEISSTLSNTSSSAIFREKQSLRLLRQPNEQKQARPQSHG